MIDSSGDGSGPVTRASDARREPGASGSAAASASLDRYRRLVESLMNYAIFELTADGSIASWNAGSTQIFGYSEAEVVGKNYSLIFTAEDIARGRPPAELAASLESGTSSVDGWHVRKDGTRFWCTDTVQRLRDENGMVTGFTKIVRDSNEAYTAAEMLRESEERLRLLIEGVTEYALFSMDVGGAIEMWNSGAERLFGYGEAEIVGRHFSVLYTPEAIESGIPDLEIAAASLNGSAPDDGWHRRRNGETFFASGYTTRLRPGIDGAPRGFVKVAHDETSRNRAEETIKRQAFRDALTQLPNRADFSERLRRSIALSKREPLRRFAVLFLDLDRFKIVNDSLGHAVADLMLVAVARTLERCVRPGDVVARLGGDEFTILLGDLREPSEAENVAGRIHVALQAPIVLNETEIFTSASMGIAIGSSEYDEPDQILRDADTAMYEAKARGRARHVVFDVDMHDRAVRLLNLQMDLRRAVARQEFFIEYQPIVALDSCRTIGFEALARWRHPERGVLRPDAFIVEAENIGAIIAIDRWMLHEACRQLRVWQLASGDAMLTVSVNLSGKQFAHENLLAEIRSALAAADLSARSLKLEITESVLMDRHETTTATVADVGELGVELYIDDFGTGYSSLSYLTRFPLKLLKVDRSFVGQIASNERSAVIARTVVTLAHNLGLAALAEGIETAEQLAQLRGFGCEFGQGNFFSHPLVAESARELIGHALPRIAPATVSR